MHAGSIKRDRERSRQLRPEIVGVDNGSAAHPLKPVAEYERDIETILQTLLGETGAVLVVNLIPDLTVTPRFRGREEAAEVGKRVVRFNEALRRQARAYGAEVVDLYAASQQEVPRRPELMARDGYHPSDEGYARWAELMWQGVAARIPR